MAKLVTLPRDSSVKTLADKGLCKRRLCRVLATVALVCLLSVSTVALAQRRGSEQALETLPTRPKDALRPWPWFMAFILLGLAWYPAFKNSKRELTE